MDAELSAASHVINDDEDDAWLLDNEDDEVFENHLVVHPIESPLSDAQLAVFENIISNSIWDICGERQPRNIDPDSLLTLVHESIDLLNYVTNNI